MGGLRNKIDVDDSEELIEQLSNAARTLLDKTAWHENIKIVNKKSERERFKQARDEGEDFTPNFEFKDYPHAEDQILETIDNCIEASTEIHQKHIEKYGANEITPEELQKFFKQIFRELEIYVRLASNIEDEESWRQYSEKLWPMVDKEVFENSRQKIRGLEAEEVDKVISPKELAELFREEVDRLGAEYNVETRRTAGCYNIPEKKTVVVAEGEKGERMYSEKEARMLTMHELFHSMRAYNGFQAGRESGFPEILGIHTPFYDRSEEGGALYREEATETSYENKEFDYHLRLIAAYKVANSNDYEEEFQDIVDDLIQLGGSVDRSFYLVARNREALRHHIYQAGREDWKNIENKEKMLIGKLNEKWADIFQKELGGLIEEPKISAEKLFNPRFKD